MIRLSLRLCFVFLLAVLASGCLTLNDPESSQEYRAHTVAEIQPGKNFSQSFISIRPRFNQFQIWLDIPGRTFPDGSELTVEIFKDSTEIEPLIKQVIPFREILRNSTLKISFTPNDGPPNQAYRIQLKTNRGIVHILGRNEDQYPKGTAWINKTAISADAAFRLGYDYGFNAFMGDLWIFFQRIPLIIPLLLTCLLPGRLLFLLSGLEERFDWGSRTGLSIGLSMAVIPIVLTWTSVLGLHWTKIWTWIIFGCLGSVYIALMIQNFRRKNTQETKHESYSWILDNWALVIVFGFTLFLRLIMVRDLSAPAWVDSVHHALLANLIQVNGAFPGNYAPFLEINTANYHAGFHSSLAVFSWLSGENIQDALLIFGQVINALMIFPVYLFTTTLVKSRTAGVIAALVIAAFTPMPAYYTSWGRYTQLAGLLILPAAFSLIQTLLSTPTQSKLIPSLKKGESNYVAVSVLAAIACAGLFLTHYRVLGFFGLLVIAYLVVDRLAEIKAQNFFRRTRQSMIYLIIVTLLAILLAVPWLPGTITSLFLPSLSWDTSPGKIFGDFSWNFLTSARGIFSLVMAGLGLTWAILLRKRFPWVIVIWVIGMFLAANISSLGLPGSGFINNTSVTISLFLPIATACGFLFAWIFEGWNRIIPLKWIPVGKISLSVLVVVLSFYGARAIIPILNPVTLLYRQADREAIDWIAVHVPKEEPILINAFLWGYGLYAGGDGGYWISPSAGRVTIPPPVLYGLDSASSQVYTKLSQESIQKSTNPEELSILLLKNDIYYVYVGGKGGALSPEALTNSPFFETIYAKNGAWLFSVKEKEDN